MRQSQRRLLPGLAVKDMGNWVSVYSAAPAIPGSILRNIAKAAGVFLYSGGGDKKATYMSSNFFAVYSQSGGAEKIDFPGQYTITEVLPMNGVVPSPIKSNTITVNLNLNQTRMFRLESGL